MRERDVVRLLGVMSLAMGACLVRPGPAARVFGMGDRAGVMRAIAARDLLIGLGLSGLAPGGVRVWLMVHVAADVVDGVFVLISLGSGRMARGRGLAWLALAGAGAAAALRVLTVSRKGAVLEKRRWWRRA